MDAKQLSEQKINTDETKLLYMYNNNDGEPKHLSYEGTFIKRNINPALPTIDLPTNFHKWSLDEQCKWLEQLDGFQNMPRNSIILFAALYRTGDCGSSPAEKPQWFDRQKFHRGQKFAREYLFGVAYAEILCLFQLYTFTYGTRPLFFTKNSNTPYLSFKRYLSTLNHLRNWYSEDPWVPGSSAQRSILAVRAMHHGVSQKLSSLDQDTIDNICSIENPWCPAYDMLLKDFSASCPVSAPGQCPYLVFENCPNKIKEISQCAMSCTQFAFIGYVILFPKSFGIHEATDEDMDAFCHLWRCIGYLLGIDDECNFCNGSLEEVQQRSRELIEYWVKPNFHCIGPEWEHVTRCIMAGIHYYLPGVSYEMAVLQVADCLNIDLPNVRASLTYSQWIRMHIIKFLLGYLCRFRSVREYLNAIFNASVNRGCGYTAKQYAELEKRSAKTMSL